MRDQSVPEEIVTLIHAIMEDPALCEWLFAQEQRPLSARALAFLEMSDRMAAGGEDPAIVSAVSLLARPEIYAAVCCSVRDLST
jgi:hypothetical protein